MTSAPGGAAPPSCESKLICKLSLITPRERGTGVAKQIIGGTSSQELEVLIPMQPTTSSVTSSLVREPQRPHL